jgi:hypothetical protein
MHEDLLNRVAGFVNSRPVRAALGFNIDRCVAWCIPPCKLDVAPNFTSALSTALTWRSWDSFKRNLTSVFEGGEGNERELYVAALTMLQNVANNAAVCVSYPLTQTYTVNRQSRLRYAHVQIERSMDYVEDIVVRGVANASVIVGGGPEVPLPRLQGEPSAYGGMTLIFLGMQYTDARVRLYFHEDDLHQDQVCTLSYKAVMLDRRSRRVLALNKWMTDTHLYHGNGICEARLLL